MRIDQKIMLILVALAVLSLVIAGSIVVRNIKRLPEAAAAAATKLFEEAYGEAVRGLREELSRAYGIVSSLTDEARRAEEENQSVIDNLATAIRENEELRILVAGNETEIRGLIVDLGEDDELFARGARIIEESRVIRERYTTESVD